MVILYIIIELVVWVDYFGETFLEDFESSEELFGFKQKNGVRNF